MVKSISRGERYPIDDPNVELRVGLGWSSFTCMSVDIDTVAIGLDKSGANVGRATMGVSTLAGLKHGGDALSSGGNIQEDDEYITVKLTEVDKKVETIYFAASIYAVCMPLCCIPGVSTFCFTPTTRVSVSGVTNGDYMKFINSTFDFSTMACLDRLACHIVLGGLSRRSESSDDWDFVSIGKPHFSYSFFCNGPAGCDISDSAFPKIKADANGDVQTMRMEGRDNAI